MLRFNVEDIFKNEIFILLISKIRKKNKHILKIIIKILLFYIKLVSTIILTILFFKIIYITQVQLENILISVNIPIITNNVNNLIQYPKTGDREEEVTNALKNYDESSWARFILSNKHWKHLGLDMKNLTDEQIREIAKSKKLINKNKNEIHNIEINEDLTKNYNNNKHSLNSLDDSLNLTKKTKLEENKIESDNVSNFSINTDELEENLNDQTEFKIKYSILNSSNFLEDLTKYFLSFKKKVETKSGINLDDKLQEYYNWSFNLKNNFGFNFKEEVNDKLKKINYNGDVESENSSISDISNFILNYLSDNNLNIPIISNINLNNSQNELPSQWFDSESEITFISDSGYSENILQNTLLLLIGRKIIFRNKNKTPFFITNKIWINLSFKNKIKILFAKYKSRIQKIIKRMFLIIIFRYFIRWFITFITPLFSLFVFDISILHCAIGFKITEEMRNKPLPSYPTLGHFENRASLGNFSNFTGISEGSRNPLLKKSIDTLKVENEFYRQKDSEIKKTLGYDPNSKSKSNLNYSSLSNLIDNLKVKIKSFINNFKKNNYNEEEEEELLEERFWSNSGDYKSEWIEFNDLRSKRKFENVIPNETVNLDKENPLNKYNFRGVINSEPSIPLHDRLIKKQDFIKNYKKSGWID